MTSSESTAVKERPILFCGQLVEAIIDDRKTQTRRIMKPQPELLKDGKVWKWNSKGYDFVSVVIPPSTQLLLRAQGRPGGPVKCLCPYGAPGDRLWIKTGYRTRYDESQDTTYWSIAGRFVTTRGKPLSKSGRVKRDGNHPAMFMPYWLSQELQLPVLEIVSVQVERLQEITEADAVAEGFRGSCTECDATGACPCIGVPRMTARDQFAALWREINGPASWEDNPWVWDIGFKRI